jgi:hypothetical protein
MTCHTGLACLAGICSLPPADAGDTGSTCSFVLCGGACTDTVTDPKNCGACGHDCLDTTCAGGLCLGTGVTSGTKPLHLVVDAANVYFTDGDGTVNQAPSAGGTLVKLASGIGSPYGVAVDASFVYFTSQGTMAGGFTDGAVFEIPIGGAGDGGAPTALATSRPRPQAVAVDGKQIYWLEPGATSGGGTLLSCPLGGCPANVPHVIYAAMDLPLGLALDAANVYVTTSAGGEVLRFSKATGKVTTLVTMQNLPAGIAVANGKVYWATSGDGLIQQVAVTGGASSFFATTMGTPVAVAVDPANVYWNDTNPDVVTTLGPVDSCPIPGCPPKTLATLVGQDQSAADIAIDTTYLYWIGLGGQILRVAK